VAQESDKAGLIGVNGKESGGRVRLYDPHLVRAHGVEFASIDPAPHRDVVRTNGVHATHSLLLELDPAWPYHATGGGWADHIKM
jgi:hypothetical protein